jgi:hypothetical protein
MLWEWGSMWSIEVPIPGFANLGFYDQNTQQDFEGEEVGDFPLPTATEDLYLSRNLSFADLKNSIVYSDIMGRRLLRNSAVQAVAAHLQVHNADVRVSIQYVHGDAPNTNAPNVTRLLNQQLDLKRVDKNVRDFDYMNTHADAALITVHVIEMWHFIDGLPRASFRSMLSNGSAQRLATHMSSETTKLFGRSRVITCEGGCESNRFETSVDLTTVCVAPLEKCYATPEQTTEESKGRKGVRAQCLGDLGTFECRAINGETDARCAFADGR